MQDVKDIRVSGNKEVVELFERRLEEARLGKLRYAAVVVCESPVHVDVEQAGSTGTEFAANYGLDLAKQGLFRRHQTPAVIGAALGIEYACYDLGNAPISWDFAAWLIDMEMRRIRANAPGPLRIAFRRDLAGRRWGQTEERMLDKVMRPLLSLIGAIEDQAALNATSRKEFYSFRYVVEASQRGETIPLLRPSEFARDVVRKGLGAGYITITLREAEHWPHRNSNLTAWSAFAKYLLSSGEYVIFVRDTARAKEQFESFDTVETAALDLDTRGALYAAAKCNLFVANGPWSLALFGERPWLMFNAVDPADPFQANQPDWWRDFHGIEIGQQFPWSSPLQRIIWKADDYETLYEAWANMKPALDETQAKVDAAVAA